MTVERAGSDQTGADPHTAAHAHYRGQKNRCRRTRKPPQGHDGLAYPADNIQQAGYLERLNDDKRHDHVRQQAGGGDGKAAAGAIDKQVHDIFTRLGDHFSS